jgi:sterol desaturase/sphingolipid hydroxylase (fatty acid hydroxylase superfamily)
MSYLQYIWDAILDTPLLRSAYLNMLSTTLVTYTLFLIFIPIDLRRIAINRLQPLIKSELNIQAYKDAWVVSLRNALYLCLATAILLLFTAGNLHGNYTIQGITSEYWPAEAPSIVTFVWQLGVVVLCMDFVLYLAHKALHIGPIYRYVHSYHHQFHELFSVHTMCIHPAEMFLMTPILFAAPRIAFELFGLHPMVIYFTPYIMALHGFIEHTGINDYIESWSFGLIAGSKMHFVHHQLNRNYGFYTYFWDWLFGSMMTYDDMLKRYNKQST